MASDLQPDADMHASYVCSGFSNRMGWGNRPALLIIDVCRAYWDTSSPLNISGNPAAANAPDSMRRLLAIARTSSIPVIWTKVQYTRPDMSDAGLFWLKAKVLDVWKVGDERHFDMLLNGLTPKEGDVVITKKYPSAFFGTTLASELQCMNVDTLIICGVSTSGCVRASALDAMQHGFRPMVVDSACGDRTLDIHRSNLFDMDAKYADVVSEAEATRQMKAGWNVSWSIGGEDASSDALGAGLGFGGKVSTGEESSESWQEEQFSGTQSKRFKAHFCDIDEKRPLTVVASRKENGRQTVERQQCRSA